MILTNVGIKAWKWCYFYDKKSFDLVFILSKVDWVVTWPCSTEFVAPVRETKENDATWATKERDFESQKIVLWLLCIGSGSLPTRNVLAVIKNMIEPAIVGSILECDTVTKYLDRIKSQFTGTSKTYATQLIKQLVTECYSGNSGIRELTMRCRNYDTVVYAIFRGRE